MRFPNWVTRDFDVVTRTLQISSPLLDERGYSEIPIRAKAVFPKGTADAPDFRFCIYMEWDKSLPHLSFVGMNPSKAMRAPDHTHSLDQTVRTLFEWSFLKMKAGRASVLNCLPIYATTLADGKNRAGFMEDNLRFIEMICKQPDTDIYAAWGVENTHYRDAARQAEVKIRNTGVPLYCLGLSKNKRPIHPMPRVRPKGRDGLINLFQKTELPESSVIKKIREGL